MEPDFSFQSAMKCNIEFIQFLKFHTRLLDIWLKPTRRFTLPRPLFQMRMCVCEMNAFKLFP